MSLLSTPQHRKRVGDQTARVRNSRCQQSEVQKVTLVERQVDDPLGRDGVRLLCFLGFHDRRVCLDDHFLLNRSRRELRIDDHRLSDRHLNGSSSECAESGRFYFQFVDSGWEKEESISTKGQSFCRADSARACIRYGNGRTRHDGAALVRHCTCDVSSGHLRLGKGGSRRQKYQEKSV